MSELRFVRIPLSYLEQTAQVALVCTRQDGVALLVGEEEVGGEDDGTDGLGQPALEDGVRRQVLGQLQGDSQTLVGVTHGAERVPPRVQENFLL